MGNENVRDAKARCTTSSPISDLENTFTVHIWSSPNKLGVLGIVAHFIDGNGELVSYCIALREVHGKHSGENQAYIVMNVVEDYGIVTQIGYFVSDNADSNDTVMNALQKCTILSLY